METPDVVPSDIKLAERVINHIESNVPLGLDEGVFVVRMLAKLGIVQQTKTKRRKSNKPTVKPCV